MKKYLFLQFKKASKLFPFVLAVTLALFIGLGVVFGLIVKGNSQKAENKIFNIALTGDTDNEYLKLGMTALATLDETRFSIEFTEMEVEEAAKALEKSEISAYVVLPPNFMERALAGDVEPIRYVTTTGNNDVITLFKNEVTKLVTDMVVSSQKGSYGLADAMVNNGQTSTVNHHMTRLTIKYVDLILKRTNMISVEELGINSGLTLIEYYICGIFIMFIMLMGLPFATLYIKDDFALSRLLVSKGYSNLLQQFCEYIVHLVSYIAIVAAVLLGVVTAGKSLGVQGLKMLTTDVMISFGCYVLPVIVLITAFNSMIFEISSNMVSGVLLHFFATLGLCYVSGCFYPIYAFPSIVQKISSVLPISIARQYLSTFFTGKDSALSMIVILAYAVLFFVIALALRSFKTVKGRGGNRNAKIA